MFSCSLVLLEVQDRHEWTRVFDDGCHEPSKTATWALYLMSMQINSGSFEAFAPRLFAKCGAGQLACQKVNLWYFSSVTSSIVRPIWYLLH